MPFVTVWPTPNGLPTAKTRSPTRISSLSRNARLEARKVGFAVSKRQGLCAHHPARLGLKLATVRQHDGQLLRAVDNMMIGHNQPRTVNNHAEPSDCWVRRRGGKIIAKNCWKNGSSNNRGDAERRGAHRHSQHLEQLVRPQAQRKVEPERYFRAPRALCACASGKPRERKKPQKNKKTRGRTSCLFSKRSDVPMGIKRRLRHPHQPEQDHYLGRAHPDRGRQIR